MTFKIWLENNTEFTIPISKLYGWTPKVQTVLADISANRLSMSRGEPVIVSRLDNPRGAFFIVDGYHRVIEEAMAKKKFINAILNVHVPRIERTGGAFTEKVSEKIRILDAI